jgi:monovalent cation:H+ antiporter-2, CPA2 family
MEQFDFLTDLVVVYATAAAVVFLFQRLRLPAIVGLLVAGIIVGPYGLSLAKEVSRVELLADIGVVLLLFTVGMEFTRERLLGMGHLLGIGLSPLEYDSNSEESKAAPSQR